MKTINANKVSLSCLEHLPYESAKEKLAGYYRVPLSLPPFPSPPSRRKKQVPNPSDTCFLYAVWQCSWPDARVDAEEVVKKGRLTVCSFHDYFY